MVATLTMNGKRYVLVPEDEYELLRSRSLAGEEPSFPPLPEPGADGTYPAIEYARTSLARKLILARRRVGLSQAEVARRAGIRIETLNRIEKGRHSTSVATVEKIDRVLRAAETPEMTAERTAAKAGKRHAADRSGRRRSQ